jgi:hypothetical protein
MPPYTNVTTNTTYILNTKKMNFSQAESYCNDNGGHLASWNNREEQMEVEQHFINAGVLFPHCHQIYWMGLRAKNWPRFNWLDSLLMSPGGFATLSQLLQVASTVTVTSSTDTCTNAWLPLLAILLAAAHHFCALPQPVVTASCLCCCPRPLLPLQQLGHVH